jgi:hypothetical protein
MLGKIVRFLKETVTIDNSLVAMLLVLFGVVQVVTRL